MGAIRAGETWRIRLIDELLLVKVIEPGETLGWWKCVELATGAEVTIPTRWFIGRLDDGEP
jgi:hypothetical protein